MSVAHNLLDELAGIGADVEPAGMKLILRAGPTAIPASLVRRVRNAKNDLIAILGAKGRSFENEVVRWLDEHPAPSAAGQCAWCGARECPGAVVLPFGTTPGTHTWLHAECWRPWQKMRRVQAMNALSRFGVTLVPARSEGP